MAHLTDAERSEIAILHAKGFSDREIGEALGRDHTVIGRERKRNGTRRGYDPRVAKVRARQRRRYSKYQGMKVRERPALQKFIVEKMESGWTPEEIAGRIKHVEEHLPYVSAKGIYKWLYSIHGQRHCHLLVSQRMRPRKRYKHEGRRLIPDRIGIEKRPQGANNRSRYGHYEADTMVSGKRHDSTTALSVMHERKARYVRLRKIPNLKPATFADALKKTGNDLLMKTMTFDNGIENRDHMDVAEALHVKTFFCQPYHSWEKGGVENTIGRIRRYIPKGTDIAGYSDEDLARVEHWLNHTPRKCLNFKTPYEIMTENLLFTTSPNPSGAFEG